MKAKYKSEPLEAIHESMKDLYEIGLLPEERMREFDSACLVKLPVPGTSAKKPSAIAPHGYPVFAGSK
jgi:DNA-binding transcriptional regulator YiaG